MVAVCRDAVMDIETPEGAEPVVRLTVSSETPCLVIRTWQGKEQPVYEILDHAEGSINRTYIRDGLPIRDGHGGDQIASILQPAVTDGKLGGVAVWSATERAKALQSDCVRRVRRNVSVEGHADPRSYVAEGEQNGRPVVRAKLWTPTGAALVSSPPADPTVGIARQAPAIVAHHKETTMAEEILLPDPVALRNAEVIEIFTLARQQNIDPECTQDVLKRGITAQAFGMEILAGKAQKLQPKAVTPGTLGAVLNAKEVQKFSLHRAIEAKVSGQNCFEREVSDTIAGLIGKRPQGFYIPNEVFRTMSVLGTGAALVQTDLLAGSFIDMLRSALALQALGVTQLVNMVGDVEIPKQLTGSTAYWVGRDGTVTASDQTFGLVKATPHTVGARTLVGRSMLKQASINAEMFTQRDLTNAIATSIDVKAFAGLGGNELTGLKLATGINNPTVSASAMTWVQALGFEGDIRADNAFLGSAKWAMPSAVLANVKSRNKGTDGEWICVTGPDGTARIDGRPVVESNNLPAKSIWYGCWAEMVLVMWGAVDLNVDPYTSAATGGVYITALQDLDTLVRNPQAFAWNAAAIS